MSELRRRLLRLEPPRHASLTYTISDSPGDTADEDPRGAKLSPVMTEAEWQREHCEEPQPVSGICVIAA